MESDPSNEKYADVPVPKEGLDFDREKAEAWIAAEEDEEIKAIKRKIIDNIQHVPFEEFKKNSAAVISGAIEELSKSSEKYALFFDYKPHSSKRWVAELNREVFDAHPPTEVRYFTPAWEKMSGHRKLKELSEGGTNTFLITDDGAYSGEQIVNRQIAPILKFYKESGLGVKPKFVIAIPYVTNRFLKLMEETEAANECTIEVKGANIMSSLGEILSEEEKTTLQAKRGGKLNMEDSEVTYLGAGLTYFDHRVADGHSFSEEVRRELGLNAPKPYGDESTEYYRREEQAFGLYKEEVMAAA